MKKSQILLSALALGSTLLLPRSLEGELFEVRNIQGQGNVPQSIDRKQIRYDGIRPIIYEPMGTATITLGPQEDHIYAMILNPATGYLDVGTNTSGMYDNRVVRVNMGFFSREGSLRYSDVLGFSAAAIDTQNDFEYFCGIGGVSFPAKIKIIQHSTFTPRGEIVLNPGENLVTEAFVEDGHLFLTIDNVDPTVDGTIIDYDLSTLSRAGSTKLSYGHARAAAVDSVNNIALLGVYKLNEISGRILKIDLNTLQEIDGSVLKTGEKEVSTGGFNPVTGFAYFITNTRVPCVIEINPSTMTETRSSCSALNQYDNTYELIIDPPNNVAYIPTYRAPGEIKKFDIPSFSVTGVRPLGPEENYPMASGIDLTTGFFYLGTNTQPGKVIRSDRF